MIFYPEVIFIVLLGLASCKTLDQAPITTLYVIDTDHQICAVREITDKKTLASRWVKDIPLTDCDGTVGLDSKEFLDLRTYLKGGASNGLPAYSIDSSKEIDSKRGHSIP